MADKIKPTRRIWGIAVMGLLIVAALPLFRLTQDAGARQVFGLYSGSYFGIMVMWWCACGVLLWMVFFAKPNERKVMIFKSIMFAISLSFVLLILEIFLHVFPRYIPLTVRSRLAGGGAFLEVQGAVGTVAVPGVRFSLTPNQVDLMTMPVGNIFNSIRPTREGKSGVRTYTRRTDHQGFCNDTSVTGVVHCLFIGDSFTEMSHLPSAERWTTLLAQTKQWSSRNLGKGGISPAEAVRILDAYGESSRPAVVLFSVFEGNDPWDEDCWVSWRESGLSYNHFLIRKEPYQNRIILFKWYEFLANHVATLSPVLSRAPDHGAPSKMTFLAPFRDRLLTPPRSLESFRGYRSLCNSLIEAGGWCKKHNAKLVVVLWPSKEHVYALEYSRRPEFTQVSRLTDSSDALVAQKRLSEIVTNADTFSRLVAAHCRDNKITFISVLTPLSAMVTLGRDPFYLDDIHPNQDGNSEVARFLAGQLALGEQ